MIVKLKQVSPVEFVEIPMDSTDSFNICYRVDCDGCGLKDEHDNDDGTPLAGHIEVDDAYASAACTDCENSPRMTHTKDGKDYCPPCLVKFGAKP